MNKRKLNLILNIGTFKILYKFVFGGGDPPSQKRPQRHLKCERACENTYEHTREHTSEHTCEHTCEYTYVYALWGGSPQFIYKHELVFKRFI